MSTMKTLQDLSVIELKAIAFDLATQANEINQKLSIVQQEISKRGAAQGVASDTPVAEKPKTPKGK